MENRKAKPDIESNKELINKLPRAKFMVVANPETSPEPFGLKYNENSIITITGEDKENYYGRGFPINLKGKGSLGLSSRTIDDQKFPKDSLRILSNEEIKTIAKSEYYIPGMDVVQYKLSRSGEIMGINFLTYGTTIEYHPDGKIVVISNKTNKREVVE